MKLILITSPKTSKGRYELKTTGLAILLCVLCIVPVLLGLVSYYTINRLDNPVLNQAIAQAWNKDIAQQKQSLEQIREDSELELQALSLSLAKAHARLIRVEALGEKLLETGKFSRKEFNFSAPPPLGGLEESIGEDAFGKPQFAKAMDDFMIQLQQRELQLQVLDSLLNNQLMEKEVFLAGRPIKKGWMSSFFGSRLDPFSGKLAHHKGVDFAGKEDAEIIAVASGVVTWSGDRYGYGNLVEIDHGQGFKTRYAHNKKNLVQFGEIVRKGQTLALMGSTGRSTGPHTHFEVLRNGHQVNPERYVYRENR